MITARKQHEQVSKMTAASIAQPSDILNTGKRILRVVTYGEVALSYRAADKRAGSFSLHHQGLFIVTKLNYFVGVRSCRILLIWVVTHFEFHPLKIWEAALKPRF